MEILLDTAHVEDIRRFNDYYEIAGVTTNPSILSKEKGGFYEIIEAIRDILGEEKSLHIQLTALTAEEMLREADAIIDRMGRKNIFIKIPVNQEGIKTMKYLHKAGIHTTATAIYSVQQTMLAASVGADYAAVYYNRMRDLNLDSKKAIAEMTSLINREQLGTRVVAASFRNVGQIIDALTAGAPAVTAAPELIAKMSENSIIQGAIDKFREDWTAAFGDKRIYELD